MELKGIAEKALQELKKSGSQKSLVQVSRTTAKEFNAEAGKMTLLRTTFDQNVSMKSVLDQNTARASANQFSDEALQSLSQEAVSSAKASPADEANGFAAAQGVQNFNYGSAQANDEWMHSQLSGVLKEVQQRYPKTILEGATVKFIQTENVLATSEGTLFTGDQGYYEGFVMFTTKDGKKSSSFNYTGFQIGANGARPDSPTLMQTSGLEELIRQSSEQIEVKKVPEKFEGDIIITPHCMGDFAGSWLRYLSGGTMLKKSSFFQDKKGQKVASDKWTLKSMPRSSQFASQSFWTGDGYATENETIFEKGVLQNYLLNHYAAQKLGQKTNRSSGDYLHLESGDVALQEMISKVKNGILLARFSGGMPAENGDFSGVAKNSYYIKDGRIQYPVAETMISGNLARMLMDLQDISKESINMGYGQFPWARFSKIVVS